jgi:transposase-like protein
MVRTGRPSLSGEVEVDETFVGGVEHGGSRGRGTDKSIVVIAVEVRKPKGLGRVRMRHVPDASGDNLIPFVADAAESGSTILTDGWGGYNDLPKHGFKREKRILSDSGDPAHVSMPGVHRVASLLKRWLLGTHQGSVDTTHLQAYLEEFTFRFNRRHSKSRGLVFRRLLEQAASARPVTEVDVAGGYSWPDRRNERKRS